MIALLAGVFALPPAGATDVAPHFSYPKAVTANGYGAVIFANDRLSDAYPHLYQQYDASTVTPEVLYDSYWGWVGGRLGGWWNGDAEVSYLDEAGTGVIRIERPVNDFGIALHEYAFMPMEAGGFGLAQVACVENTTDEQAAAFSLLSLHNWHLGGTEVATAPAADEVRESGFDLSLRYEAPGAYGSICSGLYDAVSSGYIADLGCETSGDDVVPGFVWNVPSLPAGGDWCVGTYTAAADAPDWVAGRPADAWVPAESSWWASWHAEGAEPAMADDEAHIYRQALAFLKMGQVLEEGAPYGQIPASLPLSAPVGEFQHIWNITWVRDASYAVAALVAAGHTQEAADALAFMIQPGTTGDFRAYTGDAEYAVSVCRLYGNGDEWSDTDASGPNVEFDNFGLFLWALGQLRDAGRADVVADLGPRALDGVADVLVRLIDPNTGLLLPDSSIWERHWNGNQQQFTYSSTWAVAGLRAAADVARDLGDARADGYDEAADRIAAAIPEHLVDASGVIAASREQLESAHDYLDLAALEVFNHGVLDPGGPEFVASMDAWNAALAVASGHGYQRNDDGDTYDSHEWIVIDLRLAEAHLRASAASGGSGSAAADALEDWVTAQARENAGIIPELMNPTTGDYAGPAPMLGFGSGAYVYYLHQRDAFGGGDSGDTGDTGDGSDSGDDGKDADVVDCGCAATPVDAAPAPRLPLLAAVAALVALVTRRRTLS